MTTSDLDYFSGLANVMLCALCRPGTRTLTRQCSGAWNPTQIENFVTRASAASLAARSHGLTGNCQCWQFERAWAFCGIHDDGSVLVLITQPDPENQSQLRAAAESFAGQPTRS